MATKQSEGSYCVVDGAIYKCGYGSIPSQIMVSKNQKTTIQNKPVVTKDETTFKSPAMPFGTCTQNPNPQAKTCQYAQGTWKPNTLFDTGTHQTITEDSEMLCPVFGGTLSNVYHGQVAGVSTPSFVNLQMEIASASNSMAPEKKEEKKAKPLPASNVSKISVSHIEQRVGKEITLKAFYQGVELTDKAINWAVFRIDTREEVITPKSKSSKKQKDSKPVQPIINQYEYIDKSNFFIYEKVSSPFIIKLKKTGLYRIEGFGSDKTLTKYKNLLKDDKVYESQKNSKITNPPYDKSCSTEITIQENARIKSFEVTGIQGEEFVEADNQEEKAQNPRRTNVENPAVNELNKLIDSIKNKNQSTVCAEKSQSDHTKVVPQIKPYGSSGQSTTNYNDPSKWRNNYNYDKVYYRVSNDGLTIKGKLTFPIVEIKRDVYSEAIYMFVNGIYQTEISTNGDGSFLHTYRLNWRDSNIDNKDIEIIVVKNVYRNIIIDLKNQNLSSNDFRLIHKEQILEDRRILIKRAEGIAIIETNLPKNVDPLYVRPKETIIANLKLRPNSQFSHPEKIEWTSIYPDKTKVEVKTTGLTNIIFPQKEGNVKMSVNLKEAGIILSDQKKDKLFVWDFLCIVKANYIKDIFWKSVDTNDGFPNNQIMYEGVNYKILPTFFYDNFIPSTDDIKPNNDGIIIIKIDDKEYPTNLDHSINYQCELTSFKEGKNEEEKTIHTISYSLKNEFKAQKAIKKDFFVAKPLVKMWQFTDSKEIELKEVGFGTKLFLDIYIPVWGDVDPKDVKLHLWNFSGTEKKIIEVDAISNAKFSNRGKAHVEFKFEKGKIDMDGKDSILIGCSLTNSPCTVYDLVTDEDCKGHYFYKSAKLLKLTTKRQIRGYFSGSSGYPQKSVMKYRSLINIILYFINYQKIDRSTLSLQLVENNEQGDEEDKVIWETKLDSASVKFEEEEGKATIDITQQFRDESVHGDNPNPRLFYFRVFENNKLVYVYPESPADVFDLTFDVQQTCDEENGESVNCRDTSVTISNQTSSDSIYITEDGRLKNEEETISKIRSYLWQLKVNKDTKSDSNNSTLSKIAPVVVGEELSKNENEMCDVCDCMLYDLPWGSKWTCAERKKIVQICANLWGEGRKVEMARHLMNCIAVETGGTMRSSAEAKKGGAVGLIQFIQKTIDEVLNVRVEEKKKLLNTQKDISEEERSRILGFKIVDKTKLANMSICEQLDYVELYFNDNRLQHKVKNAEDLYMFIFCPKGIGQSPDFVLYDKEAGANYEKNKSLDGQYYDEATHKLCDGKEKKDKIYRSNAIARVKEMEYKGQFYKTPSRYPCQIGLIQHDYQCPWCNKGHIDLSGTYTFRFQGKGNYECFNTSKKIILQNKTVADVQGPILAEHKIYTNFDSLRTRTGGIATSKDNCMKYAEFQLALENGESFNFASQESYKKAIDYLDQELEHGRAVVAGVSHTFRVGKNANMQFHNDGTTDHYIAIIGRTCYKKKTAYVFWDVGVSDPIKYVFTLDEENHYCCCDATRGTRYFTLTQIRRNILKH